MADTTFSKRPFIESCILLRNKLSGATYRIVEMLSASATYHDDVVILPPVKKLAQMLSMGLSTVYRCLNQIEQVLPFIRFQKSSSFITVYRTDPDNPKNFFDYQNQESFRIQKNFFLEFRKISQNLENQQLELLPDKAFNSPKTLQTVKSHQTGEGVDEKVNKEEELPKEVVEKQIDKQEEKDATRFESEDSVSKAVAIKYTVLPKHREKKVIPPSVTQKKYDIPEELIEKLRMFDVKTSEEVLVKISEHHISQAYGAIAHIENTFETIRDKTAVFLYQLPKQPVEQLGQRYSDEFLEKQKQENERIDKEKEDPFYLEKASKAFKRIRQSLAKKSSQ